MADDRLYQQALRLVSPEYPAELRKRSLAQTENGAFFWYVFEAGVSVNTVAFRIRRRPRFAEALANNELWYDMDHGQAWLRFGRGV